MLFKPHFLFWIFVLLWSAIGQAQITSNTSAQKSISRLDTLEIRAKIIRVIDGDTAEMMYHDLFLKVRLDHIDAPEIRGGQAYGRAAGQYLRRRIEGEEVLLKGQRKLDGFGRFLATVYTLEGLNINKEMVKNGYAWHFSQYSKDTTYRDLEAQAKQHKRGLWKEKSPVAPWTFRKR